MTEEEDNDMQKERPAGWSAASLLFYKLAKELPSYPERRMEYHKPNGEEIINS